MTQSQLLRARAIFDAAVAAQADRRESLLQHECGDDAVLRGWIDQLLSADAGEQPILDHPGGFAAEAIRATGIRIDPASLQPGQSVGRYRIVAEIGQGRMGTVYQAEPHGALPGVSVAIKILRFTSPDILDRFRQEHQILSSLEHPNISRLLDSGTTGRDTPYLVMEYIAGTPIPAYCETNRLNVRDRIRLFLQVCDAVAYLHRHLVVHRDLKPGNVLVTSGGTVKLLDFGIAKILRPAEGLHASRQTVAGLMTPDYASPEQIQGGLTSTLTDVYSLGVLLYELLTGHRPFASQPGRLHENLRRILEEDPPRPSLAAEKSGKDGRGLRGELDNIILKAMRREPEARYVSVEQFSADLRFYLTGQPVLAQGESLVYRGRKFVLRNRSAVLAAAVAAGLLVVGIFAVAREARIAGEQQLRAEAKAAEAELHRQSAERRLAELQAIAGRAVDLYNVDRNGEDSSTLIARSVRDSLLALGKERTLEPQMIEVLKQTQATIQNHQPASNPHWQVPPGWTASQTVPNEYRVIAFQLQSLVPHPSGRVDLLRRLDAAPYRGHRVRLAALLRTGSPSSEATLTLDTSGTRATTSVSGTTAWKKYDLVQDVPQSAATLEMRLTLHGSGALWADGLALQTVSSSVPLTHNRPQNLDFQKDGELNP